MKRDHIYYTVIGAGLLIIIAAVLWTTWPDAEEPLAPPVALAQQISSNAPKEEKVKAAQDFIRHGEAARVEIRTALDSYEQQPPEVVAPLLQATMKTRDYRSMPTLLKLLEHEDPVVRGRAGAAVQKILGADFGFRANASESERKKVIATIKQDYANSAARINEFYKDQ